jgi:hypothetical protein
MFPVLCFMYVKPAISEAKQAQRQFAVELGISRPGEAAPRVFHFFV